MKKQQFYLTIAFGIFSIGAAMAQDAATTQVATEVVKIVPNYKENLKLFIGLLVMTAVLLFAINMVSHSIKSLLSSDYYKNRILLKKQEETGSDTPKSTLLSIGLIGLFLFHQLDVMAMTIKIEDGDNPWLLIEKADIIMLLVLNLVLLGVLLYLKRMFKQLLENVRLASEKRIEAPTAAKSFKKLNQALTDVVPIEHEDKIIMDHEFDGIRELDNNLPPWWVIMFFLTIVFAIGYMCHYHIFKTGDLQSKEYAKEMKQAEMEVQAYLSKMAMNVDENSATVMEDESDISAGKSIFINNCVVCHMDKGEGNIGPNLTDEYWLTGADIKTMFRTIKYGTAMGMPEHASKLNPIQIQQVASYVYQLPFAAGKEPEGEKMSKEEVVAE